jgi:hypothetical protein
MTQTHPNSTGARWARFRFSVVGSLLSSPPARGALKTAIRSLAEKSWSHPTSGRDVHFAAATTFIGGGARACEENWGVRRRQWLRRADYWEAAITCWTQLRAVLESAKLERSQRALSRRAAAQVSQVMHAQPGSDLAQACASRGEESAKEAAAAELLEPSTPALHAAAESFEDSRYLGRHRGLAVAEKPARVIDQQEIVAQ